MLRLECGYQQYAWGKVGSKSKVAKMIGKADDATGRYAELWIGTHPSKPARLHGTASTLKEALSSQQRAAMGISLLGTDGAAAEYAKKYGADIPFLLKILSVDTALSVQAHPNRAHAKELHARDPTNYPDANHKPELVVALTPYRALCCFRPLGEIAQFLQQIAPLRDLVGNHAEIMAAAAAATDARHTRLLLRAALESVYSASAAAVQAAIGAHLAVLPLEPSTDADAVFRMLTQQYPGDVGCWMVYLLNLVHLKPGDALFLGPNEPHSYLSGDSVEIMACSDNVVRAGLTPKFKDVPTLIEMLTYRTDSLAEAHTPNNNEAVQQYVPPPWCDEFMLTTVRIAVGGAPRVVQLPSVALGVVTDGSGSVNGVDVVEGTTFVIASDAAAAGVVVQAAEGSALTVFIATINASSTAAKL